MNNGNEQVVLTDDELRAENAPLWANIAHLIRVEARSSADVALAVFDLNKSGRYAPYTSLAECAKAQWGYERDYVQKLLVLARTLKHVREALGDDTLTLPEIAARKYGIKLNKAGDPMKASPMLNDVVAKTKQYRDQDHYRPQLALDLADNEIRVRTSKGKTEETVSHELPAELENRLGTEGEYVPPQAPAETEPEVVRVRTLVEQITKEQLAVIIRYGTDEDKANLSGRSAELRQRRDQGENVDALLKQARGFISDMYSHVIVNRDVPGATDELPGFENFPEEQE